MAALRAELQEAKGNLEASKGEVKELQEERRGLQAEVWLILFYDKRLLLPLLLLRSINSICR